MGEVIEVRDIGKNIKDLRIKSNLTQEELAEELFVTRQTISNYENGKSRPDVDMIVRIAELLNVDANTVIYGIPLEQDKRAKYRRIIIMTAIVVVLGILMAYLYHVSKLYRNQAYISSPYSFIAHICIPGMWILFGLWLIDVLSLIVVFKPCFHASVKYIRAGVLLLLIVIFVILLAELVIQVTFDLTTGESNISFPYIPLLSDISFYVIYLTNNHPILYSFFGIAFRLLGFPKLKKK
jgi:transcriptional regulator with XRE-family HTH domain